MPTDIQVDEERLERWFWPKVARDDVSGCWIWKGTKNTMGYGRFRVVPQGRSVAAHRMMYQLTKGPIPDGMCVLHRCDNPSCVNPACLEVGTSAKNSRQMVERGRSAKGSRHGSAVLTREIVRQIRHLSDNGLKSQRRMAEIFGVSQRAIGFVCRRETWTHVYAPPETVTPDEEEG